MAKKAQEFESWNEPAGEYELLPNGTHYHVASLDDQGNGISSVHNIRSAKGPWEQHSHKIVKGKVMEAKKDMPRNKLDAHSHELGKSAEEVPRIIRKEIMVPKIVDICPHCQQEIGEKEMFCANPEAKPLVWKHSCGGLVRSSKEAEQEAEEVLKNLNLDVLSRIASRHAAK